jgi:hypothetical protein
MQPLLTVKFNYYDLCDVINHSILHIPAHYVLYKTQRMILNGKDMFTINYLLFFIVNYY